MSISSLLHIQNRLRQERIARNWRQQDLADQLGTSVLTVRRWERGSHQPSSYFRIKLCTLFGKSTEDLGLVAGHSPYPSTSLEEHVGQMQTALSPVDKRMLWTVPYPRNPHFTGRDELLDQLAQRFSPVLYHVSTTTSRTALIQTQAIKGLGGIGKTQLAVEYAYRSRDQGRYTHTLWVNAVSEEAILASFAELAEQLPAFPAKQEQDQWKLVAAIKYWFEQCQQPWLLIFDNVYELLLAQPYFPSQGHGSLLLTTRAHALGSLVASIEVENLSLAEGTTFLLHRVQRQQVQEEERTQASQVVMALDGFPLALDQAGAYIEETQCCFGDYVQLYPIHRQALLARRGSQVTTYPDSVATTWSLALQKIEQTNPAAVELLRLCAFLAPGHISETLLRQGVAHWPPLLQQATGHLFAFNQLFEALLQFSFVKRLVEDHTLSIHRLVQAVLQDSMPLQEQKTWIGRLLTAFEQMFPSDSQLMECWQWCDLLLPHVLQLLTLSKDKGDPLIASSLWYKVGGYFHHRVQYLEEEIAHRHALNLREQELGTCHQDLIDPLIGLAEATCHQGKYAIAALYTRRAINLIELTRGKENFTLIAPLNVLARISCTQSCAEEAERLLLRALSIWLATTYAELSHLEPFILRQQGENLCMRDLILCIQPLLQPLFDLTSAMRSFQRYSHPISQTLSTLSHLYYQQQRYEEAEVLLWPVYVGGNQLLGKSHPVQALLLMKLAAIYTQQGRVGEAEQCYVQARHIREHALGSYPHALIETL